MIFDRLVNNADFILLSAVAGALVFLTVRLRQGVTYRFAVGLAFIASFLVVWINLAVGIIGEPDEWANVMYVGVLAIGIIGTALSRLQPAGMSRAMFVTALAQALVVAIVLVSGLGLADTGPRFFIVVNALLTALWLGSAFMFRSAARAKRASGGTRMGWS